ncbi:MAG TPA: hypothetical protein VMG55_11480 [Stellaceae bacterium]|nr:hypothetical protein [Stellaceae bacterium]
MTEAVTVRRGREGDAEAIRALTREAYAKWVDVIGREPLPMQIDYSTASESTASNCSPSMIVLPR